jgi:hypothetical protein
VYEFIIKDCPKKKTMKMWMHYFKPTKRWENIKKITTNPNVKLFTFDAKFND